MSSKGMLEAIGNTPLVRLRTIVPDGAAEVLVKLEYYNPTGSYKDRMALSMIERMERAREIASEGPSYATDQMRNPDMVAGYESLGEELLEQIERPIHTFCAAVGTSGMLMGTARVLLRREPRPRIVAFEPATSSVLTGGKPGTHGVEGVAPGFVPPQFDRSLVSEARGVSETSGRRMASELARREGIFAGTSTGLNLAGALQIAREIGSAHTVVTVAVDSGFKYLAGDLYAVTP